MSSAATPALRFQTAAFGLGQPPTSARFLSDHQDLPMTTTDYTISIDNLSKAYGSFKALEDLNLHIQPGEIFGFLGPNGAGKTTTINLLMGLRWSGKSSGQRPPGWSEIDLSSFRKYGKTFGVQFCSICWFQMENDTREGSLIIPELISQPIEFKPPGFGL